MFGETIQERAHNQPIEKMPEFFKPGYVERTIEKLPEYIPPALRRELGRTHPDILVTYKEPSITETTQEGQGDTPEQKYLYTLLNTGSQILDEITTTTLASTIVNQTSEKRVTSYNEELGMLINGLGLDDTFVGLIEHLHIAYLSGDFRDVNDYLWENYKIHSLYYLIQNIGLALEEIEDNKLNTQNKLIMNVTCGSFNYDKHPPEIYINKRYLLEKNKRIQYVLSLVSLSLLSFSQVPGFMLNTNNPSEEIKLITSATMLALTLSLGLTAYGFTKFPIAQDTYTHETLHYLSYEKGETNTRVGFTFQSLQGYSSLLLRNRTI